MEGTGSSLIIILLRDSAFDSINLNYYIMKIRSINILSLIMIGFVILLGSCEEKDDYNFSDIEPVIFSITGPGTAPAHGLTEFPVRFHVPHRGGSSFQWSVTTLLGGSATIVIDDKYSSIAYITFTQSDVTDVATITVTETTMGGKTTQLSREINLTPFCPIPDEIQGEYHEEDEDGWDFSPVVFTKDPTDPAGLIAEGVIGSFFGGPGGKVKFTLDYCTGTFRLEKQPTGIVHAVYGMVSLEQTAGTEGTYDFDTGVFTITMKITVAAGSFGDYEYYFTPLF